MSYGYKIGLCGFVVAMMACSHTTPSLNSYRQQRWAQDSLSMEQHARSITYCDSLLTLLLPQIDTLLPHFVYEKAEQYADKGYYVHRFLQTNRHIQHCFLQPRVRDDGQVYIKSYYFGNHALKHTAITLSTQEVSTHVVGSLHSFQAEGYYEIMTLPEEASLTLLQFINGYTTSRLCVTLEGKTQYVYTLPPKEVSAIMDTYQLAILFKDVQRLENQERQASKQVEKYKKRLEKAKKFG